MFVPKKTNDENLDKHVKKEKKGKKSQKLSAYLSPTSLVPFKKSWLSKASTNPLKTLIFEFKTHVNVSKEHFIPKQKLTSIVTFIKQKKQKNKKTKEKKLKKNYIEQKTLIYFPKP